MWMHSYERVESRKKWVREIEQKGAYVQRVYQKKTGGGEIKRVSQTRTALPELCFFTSLRPRVQLFSDCPENAPQPYNGPFFCHFYLSLHASLVVKVALTRRETLCSLRKQNAGEAN